MDNMKLWYLSKRRAARAKGVPPLMFESNGQPITRWSIEGSVGGVGDRTENLFNKNSSSGNGYINDNGKIIINSTYPIKTFDFIRVKPNQLYSYKAYSLSESTIRINYYTENRTFISRYFVQFNAQSIETITTPSNCEYISLSIDANIIDYTLLTEGTTVPVEYVPYGYKIPLTCGGETVNIYLDEPLRAGDSITGSPEGIEIMTNNLMPSAAAQTIVKNGMTFSCDGKGRYTITGSNNSHSDVTFTVDLPPFIIPKSVGSHGSGTFSLWNSGFTGGLTWVYHMWDNARITRILAYPENITDTSWYGSPIYNGFSIQVPNNFTGPLILCPQYTDDGVLPAEYTPYDRSIIAAIAIPTASGTNTLSVGTTVQPSSVSVSAEPDIPTSLDRYLYSRLIM